MDMLDSLRAFPAVIHIHLEHDGLSSHCVTVTTCFIDTTPELLELTQRRDRGSCWGWRQHRQYLDFLGAAEKRSQARMDGFAQAAAAAGLAAVESKLAPPPVTIDQVGALLAAMLERSPQLDAVFCNNDQMAAGVLFACPPP